MSLMGWALLSVLVLVGGISAINKATLSSVLHNSFTFSLKKYMDNDEFPI